MFWYLRMFPSPTGLLPDLLCRRRCLRMHPYALATALWVFVASFRLPQDPTFDDLESDRDSRFLMQSALVI
jgi:hypothetical protein